MSRMDSNGYNLDFDRRMASAEDAWLEPPGELVDEDEEDAFDLSGWDEHRIVWSLYLQAVACAEAKSNDVAWIFNSMKLYRKGEKKAYIFDEFKEYRYYRDYATVCEEWIKHDKLGRLDELSFAETLFWKKVFRSAWNFMYEWFEDNKSEDDEVEPPERLIYDYGIDILTEGDELLPQALVQISLRGVK